MAPPRSRFFVRALLAVVGLLAGIPLACGGSDDDAAAAAPVTGAGGSSSYEENLRAGARYVCELAATCAVPVIQQFFGGDVDRCAQREYETLAGGFLGPGIVITPEQLKACWTDVAALGCTGLYGILGGNEYPSSCLVRGKLKDGDPCAYLYQCESMNCRHTEDAVCGTCAPRLPAGSPCESTFDCDFGTSCTENVCTKRGAEGATCGVGAPCADWLACVDGVCGKAKVEGEACTSVTGECDLYVESLVCLPSKKTCLQATYAAEGEQCGAIQGKPILCSGGECLPNPLYGTCAPRAKDGAACDRIQGPACEFHAECVKGTCVSLFTQSCQ
jgi:hypothetical protein